MKENPARASRGTGKTRPSLNDNHNVDNDPGPEMHLAAAYAKGKLDAWADNI